VLGLNFDDQNISIVAAGGKTAIDTLVQVYSAHEIPTYVIFDNDYSKRAQDREYNKIICRLLGLTESDAPPAEITANYAVLEGDWELQMKTDIDKNDNGLYDQLVNEARATLGLRPDKNKPLVARYVAECLVARAIIPEFVTKVADALKRRVGLPSAGRVQEQTPPPKPTEAASATNLFDDDIPF
jgi:hypothetical protein